MNRCIYDIYIYIYISGAGHEEGTGHTYNGTRSRCHSESFVGRGECPDVFDGALWDPTHKNTTHTQTTQTNEKTIKQLPGRSLVPPGVENDFARLLDRLGGRSTNVHSGGLKSKPTCHLTDRNKNPSPTTSSAQHGPNVETKIRIMPKPHRSNRNLPGVGPLLLINSTL